MTQGPSANAHQGRVSPEDARLPVHSPVTDILARLAPVPKDSTLSPEALCAAAVRFAEELTRQVPQVVTGELRYALAGSLAVALLSQVDSFTTSKAADIENPTKITAHEMTDAARRALASIVRPIGDLDYVDTAPSGGRALGKGGKLSFQSFSEQARGIFKGSSSDASIMSDPLSHELNQEVACVYVNGVPVYVVSPSSMLSWKTQHIIEKLHGSECNPKYEGDWIALFEANRSLHTYERVLAEAAEVVHASAFTARGGAILPLYGIHISGALRDFLRDIIEASPSAALARKTGAPEHRLLAVVSVLDRLPQGEPRSQVAQMIARNPELVDPMEVDTRDPKNVEALARHLRTQPEVLSRFASQMEERSLEAIVTTHPYLFAQHGKGVDSFTRKPSRSLFLDVLARVSSNALEGDLSLIAAVKDDERALRSVDVLLNGEAMTDVPTRMAVINGIVAARPEERKKLVGSLSSISAGTIELIDNAWVSVPVETIHARLVAEAGSR